MRRMRIQQCVHFLTKGVWQLNQDELPKLKRFWLQPLRIALFTIRGYIRDNCALQASALTFYTLLSIVPVGAMVFGIAKGFGLEQRLENQLYLRFAGQEEVLSKIIDFSRSLLENTQGGLIAGIGVILLFWSAVKVLSHIENTLNHIWKVSGRSFIRKFTDYLTIMVISPLLIIVSSSVNVFITTQVMAITGKLKLLQAASPAIYMLLKILPFGLIWVLFIMIYLIMPNIQVRLSSAILGGILSGTIYQVTQGVYISAQVLVSKYNAIYGSFAALPLFLIWLQLSWMIVLLGAQIAYSHEHANIFATSMNYRTTSADFRRRYALYILRFIVQRFQKAKPPLTAQQIANKLKVPCLLVEQFINQLCESDLISAVKNRKHNGTYCYQPARDINTISIASAIQALDKQGEKHLTDENNTDFAIVSQAVEKIHKEMDTSASNKLIKDL